MNSYASEAARLRPPVNLSRIDLVSIQLLMQCAARGSISGAAQHCHLSVMGASARLRRLEDALGKPMFHRHRHGLEITEAGRVALHWARMMLEGVQNLFLEVAATPNSVPKQAVNTGRRGRQAARGAPTSFMLLASEDPTRAGRERAEHPQEICRSVQEIPSASSPSRASSLLDQRRLRS